MRAESREIDTLENLYRKALKAAKTTDNLDAFIDGQPGVSSATGAHDTQPGARKHSAADPGTLSPVGLSGGGERQSDTARRGYVIEGDCGSDSQTRRHGSTQSGCRGYHSGAVARFGGGPMDSEVSAYAWRPSEEVIERARSDRVPPLHETSLVRRSVPLVHEDVASFTEHVVRFLGIQFDRPFREVLDLSGGREWPQWCVGGGMNIVHSCLRHEGIAVIGEDESGQSRATELCRVAGRGDAYRCWHCSDEASDAATG